MRALIQDNGFKLQSYDARNIPDDILLRWKCAVNSQSRKSYYHDYEYFKSYLDNLKKKKTPLEIFAASIDSRLFFSHSYESGSPLVWLYPSSWIRVAMPRSRTFM